MLSLARATCVQPLVELADVGSLWGGCMNSIEERGWVDHAAYSSLVMCSAPGARTLACAEERTSSKRYFFSAFTSGTLFDI